MILIVTQTFAPSKGGMEVYMTGLADELANAGHEVFVLADGKDKGFVPQTPYTLRRFDGWRPLRRRKKRQAIEALAATRRVEGIICDSWKSVEALPKYMLVPIVVLAHGAEYPAAPSKRKERRIKAALARSTSILANSHFTAGVVRPFLPHPDDLRLQIVHPPIHPLADPTPDALKDMRAFINDRTPVISVVARLEPRKGIDRIVTALPSVVAKFPTAVLMIAGSGADEGRLREMVEEKGLKDHVVFLGSVDADKKSALLSCSDVFAMPVRRVGTSVEGFGISYIEAGWFGVPSLGGKGCGAEDAVIDEKTGLLCDGENQTEIAMKLNRLLDDANLRRALGFAAQTRARTELLWTQILPRFLSALRG